MSCDARDEKENETFPQHSPSKIGNQFNNNNRAIPLSDHEMKLRSFPMRISTPDMVSIAVHTLLYPYIIIHT